MATADLVIRIITDTTKATGLDKVSASAGKFRRGVAAAVGPAKAVGAAVLAVGALSVKAASDLEQATGAVESVFGRQAQAVIKYSETAATRMGLSAAAYQQYAALTGAALQNAGFSAAKAAGESDKVMQRAADMAATFGGTTADAVEAINAAVARGEYDPLEKYGVALNQTAVNAELAKRGQDDLTGAALRNAKATIALEQIYASTAKSAGQFARESDTVAGQTQIAKAQFTDAAAALGTALLPAVAKVMSILASFAKWAQKNSTIVGILIGVLGGLAAAVLIVNAAMAATNLVMTIMAANPIVLIIAGIVAAVIALGVAFMIAYKKSETFRNIVNGIGAVFVSLWGAIKAAGSAIGTAFSAILNAGKTVFNWIKKNWPLLVGLLFGPFGIAVALIIRHWSKVKAGIIAGWNAIKAVARTVANAVKTVFAAAWRAISSAARAYLNAARAVFGALRSAVSAVGSWIAARFRTVWAAVTSAVRSAVNTAKSIISGIREAVSNVITAVTNLIGKLRNIKVPGAIVSAFNAIKSAVDAAISAVSSLISAIGRIDFPSPPGWLGKLGGLNPFSAPAPAPAALAGGARGFAAPAVPTAGRVGRATPAGSGTTVVVNGALDPEAVARQIQRILAGHNRRIGLS